MADANNRIQCFACTPYKNHKDLLHLAHISYLEQADIWIWKSHMFRSISKKSPYSVNITKDLLLAKAGEPCDINYCRRSTNGSTGKLLVDFPMATINGRTFFKMCVFVALDEKVQHCFISFIHMCRRAIHIRRALAISMALHQRLGGAAAISSLPLDVLFSIIHSTFKQRRTIDDE